MSSKTSKTKTDKKKLITKENALQCMKQLLREGREKITTREELLKYPKGTLISYYSKNGIFKPGGVLIRTNDEYFVARIKTFGETVNRRISFDKLKYMFVGSPIKFCQNKKVKTKFPVTIGDKVVYYAKDNWDRRRFLGTERYLEMKNWYDVMNPDKSEIDIEL